VAIKFLPAGWIGNDDWADRLRKEVELARKVSHPAVCRVHNLHTAEDGQPFLTMEFIDGETLASSLDVWGRSTPERVVAWALQMCDGLQAIHDSGLLHRDLKPSNILLDKQGKIHLIDFGLAAVAAQKHKRDRLAGTIAYMAPEQLSEGEVSARSDLFSLGLVLYELTTKRRPFPARTAEELTRRYANRTPPPPSEHVRGLDPALDRAILRCLEFNPARRPASAAELKRMLPPLSPQETENVEGTGRLGRLLALTLLTAALLLLLLAHAWIAPAVLLFHQVPLERRTKTGSTPCSPEDLATQARTILEELGYARQPHRVSGLAWDEDCLNQLRQRPARDGRLDPVHQRQAILYFWYRESPMPLHPAVRSSPADPPLVGPGLVGLVLDTQGRLVELRAVPSPEEETEEPEKPPGDWQGTLLQAAGELASSRKDIPRRIPPMYADDRLALEAKLDGRRVRVDAAAYRGQARLLSAPRGRRPFA
jgi:hypothetical protein